MKNLLRLWFVICLAAVLSVKICALDQTTYRLDEPAISVDLPTDYIVFTREIAEDDPNLSAYGLTKDDLLSIMEDGDIYLNAWDRDVNQEIFVTVADSELSDFNQLSDIEFSTMLSELASAYEEIGITCIRSGQYQNDQAKFAIVYTSRPNGEATIYGLQYSTAYAGRTINVIMHSYYGEIDSEEERILKAIVDSVHFDAEPMQPEPAAETPSFTYEDTECGVTFTVPANWTEDQVDEDNEFVDAQFSSNVDVERSILYTSTDIWSQLSEEEKEALPRAEIDNSTFDLTEIAERIGTTEDKVSVVTYGGKEYYRVEYAVSTSVSEWDVSVDITCLLRCEDGYMYMFQFSGLDSNTYYDDFELLLSSVRYPTAAAVAEGKEEQDNNEKLEALEEKEEQEEREKPSIFFTWIASFISGLFLTVVLHPLPIWIYRYVIRKAPISPRKAKIITVIDALVVFIIMELITFSSGGRASSSAIILWSFVCYRALTNGYSDAVYRGEDEETDDSPDDETGLVGADESSEPLQGELDDVKLLQPETEARFCLKCGKELRPGSLFCSQCGAKIPR